MTRDEIDTLIERIADWHKGNPVGYGAVLLAEASDALRALRAAPTPPAEPSSLVRLVQEWQNELRKLREGRGPSSTDRVEKAAEAIMAWTPATPTPSPVPQGTETMTPAQMVEQLRLARAYTSANGMNTSTGAIDAVIAALRVSPPPAEPSSLVGLVQRFQKAHSRTETVPLDDHFGADAAGKAYDDALDDLLAWTPATPTPSPVPQGTETRVVSEFVERCDEIRHGSPNAFYDHVDKFCKAWRAALASPPPAQGTPTERAAFKAGFMATVRKAGGWSFDGPSAADREPEAWAAWVEQNRPEAEVPPEVAALTAPVGETPTKEAK